MGEAYRWHGKDKDHVDVVVRPDLPVLDRHFDDCEGNRVETTAGCWNRFSVMISTATPVSLKDLTYSGLGGVFVQVDVAAGIDPQVEFVVMDQQNPVVVIEDNG